ncbi:MAG TPA: alpha/beta hydrolase [Candidatus Dormibacteraeota bacterium]|nr:alpha/beta hydrolase [Candidatus Dormibacteraeota bacterium]
MASSRRYEVFLRRSFGAGAAARLGDSGRPQTRFVRCKSPGTAWKSKPSWYIVGKNDRTVHPDLERFLAKRMGANTTEVASSHVPMLSHPDVVIDVIRAAAKGVQGATVAA